MKCSFFGKWNLLEGVSLDGLGKVFSQARAEAVGNWQESSTTANESRCDE
jgi:recombinational DNA repair ATPase RecF